MARQAFSRRENLEIDGIHFRRFQINPGSPLRWRNGARGEATIRNNSGNKVRDEFDLGKNIL